MRPPSAKAELEQIREEYLDSTWYRFNAVEPPIGSIDSSPLTEGRGPRGRSCYIVFVTNLYPGGYGCVEEACAGFSAKTVEAALRHQRAHHFGHAPFLCIPTSGEIWYVLTSFLSLKGPMSSSASGSLSPAYICIGCELSSDPYSPVVSDITAEKTSYGTRHAAMVSARMRRCTDALFEIVLDSFTLCHSFFAVRLYDC